ncbi:MAG: hypothetical protein LAO08_06475 [Acidobacteriia bacterium]|nr:hypothetical protein [Terriglobia bacterium]
MSTSPELAAGSVIRILRRAGYEAYLVGGCVRDILLQRTAKDFDVTTNATPEQVQGIFPKTLAVGAAFGVVIVLMHDVQIEVATYRTDGQYSDGRRPDSVAYSTSAEEDVMRRDFTINGLLCVGEANPDSVAEYEATLAGATDRITVGNHTFGIVDYVGGIADVQRGVIRCIGDPDARFGEDALRMLRAVRFAAQLGFEIENATWRAIEKNAPAIKHVSLERVAMELFKLVTAPFPVEGLVPLFSTGLAQYVFPPSFMKELRMAYCLRRFERFSGGVPERGMAMLLTDAGYEAALDVCNGFKLSNEERDTILGAVGMVGNLEPYLTMDAATVKRTARRKGIKIALELFMQDEVIGKTNRGATDTTAIYNRFTTLTPEEIRPKPFITGDDLIAMGMKPGPEFRRILEDLETYQLNGEIQSREDAERRLSFVWVAERST